MNLKDYFDVWIDRKHAEHRQKDARREQVFFNRCLREMDGRDAYDYLTIVASKILNCEPRECYRFVNYYFENQEHFDCSFTEWLWADNGPLCRSSIFGLFPEFEILTKDGFEIAEMARKFYGIEIYHLDEFDGYDNGPVYAMEFSFKELNEKRVDLDKIKETVKAMIIEEVQ